MRRKKSKIFLPIIILFLLLIGCENIFSPNNGIVSGTITDENDIPYPSAKVNIDSNWTLTDSNGKFKLVGISSGNHKIEARGITAYYGSTKINIDNNFMGCSNSEKSGVIIKMTLCDFSDFKTIPGGEIYGELEGNYIMNSENSPYIVTGDIKITENSFLWIREGTEIKVNSDDIQNLGYDSGKVEIIVYGDLRSEGTYDNPVTITSSETFPQTQDWYGIRNYGNLILNYNIIKHAYFAIESQQSKNSIIGNCRIEDCSTGIYIHNNSNDANISNCSFINNYNAIILWYVNNCAIKNCLIVSGGKGIRLCCYDCKTSILYNTISGNKNYGISYSCSSTDNKQKFTIMNNIITNNNIGLFFEIPIINDYNDVYDNTVNYSGCNTGANDISVDPMFVDPANLNYRLQANSPCNTASETGGEIGAYGDGGSPF
jgi:hypothetical protein